MESITRISTLFVFICMKIWSYFNLRTFLAIAVSQVAAYLAIRFNIKFQVDLLLYGLCVVFPLHFSLQSAFKRRERALEYLSLFKGWCLALHYSFQISIDLPAERKQTARELLKGMQAHLIQQLENRIGGFKLMQARLDEVFSFVEANHEQISKRNVLRMVRYLGNVAEASTFLISLISHRTMAGLRFYSIFFIVILPLVQGPLLLHRLESVVPTWAIYVLLAFSSLILATLDNFQTLLEYPFDPKGMDNVKVREFELDI